MASSRLALAVDFDVRQVRVAAVNSLGQVQGEIKTAVTANTRDHVIGQIVAYIGQVLSAYRITYC